MSEDKFLAHFIFLTKSLKNSSILMNKLTMPTKVLLLIH